MRVGEIKNIVEKAIDTSDRLTIESEALYGGQAYRIEDYAQLITALKTISVMSWNDVDFTSVQAIIDEYGASAQNVQITSNEYSQLNSYVSTVNTKFPIYLEVIRSMTEKQGETFINIKLPGEIKSFKELTETNNRLEKLFKEFNVDGQAEFKGFDKGSDWYTICIIGITSYHTFLACLKIAQEIMKLRKEYFNSSKAKIEYQTAKEIFKQTENGPSLEEFQNKKIEKIIEAKVKEAVAAIDNKGAKRDGELTNQLVMATTHLVTALGDGIEFHLSLNPPEYAKETAGSLTIDYKKMRELSQGEEETKQITDGRNDANSDTAAG